ncbi:MAG: hypothetical protein ACXVRH_02700 [Thermoleophilaceae bacterium]
MSTRGYTLLGWLVWKVGSTFGTPFYTFLGWLAWQVGSRVAKRKLSQNRAKIGAVAAIALVLVGGAVAAKANGGED